MLLTPAHLRADKAVFLENSEVLAGCFNALSVVESERVNVWPRIAGLRIEEVDKKRVQSRHFRFVLWQKRVPE